MSTAALADPSRRFGRGDLHPLPLRPEPRAREVALGHMGKHACRFPLARGLRSLLLVPDKLRRLQRHIRLARRGHRLHAVDLDLRRDPARRRGAQCGDRAPDGARLRRLANRLPMGMRGATMADTLGRPYGETRPPDLRQSRLSSTTTKTASSRARAPCPSRPRTSPPQHFPSWRSELAWGSAGSTAGGRAARAPRYEVRADNAAPDDRARLQSPRYS